VPVVINEFTLKHITIGIVIGSFTLAIQTLELAHILIAVQVIGSFASASEQARAENKQ
jgi:hypothetical protein